MAIRNPRELQEHLQWAMGVELSTIPTYLYPLYSIEDDTSEAYRLIRSVVVEEMLHLALAANLLTAVGGRPRFYDETLVPSFPTPLPHHSPELALTLERCTPALVGRVFTTIERPEAVDSLPEDDNYETIGQFYKAIEHAVGDLAERFPLFASPRTECQMNLPGYYGPVEFDDPGSGGLQAVVDVATADQVVEVIVHQGEGLRDELYADPDHKELTHYYKFKQIADGDVPVGEARPVMTNPKTADFPESLRPVSNLFNATYSYALLVMDDLYSPLDAGTRGRLVNDLYTLMTGVMRPVGRYLTRQPASADGGEHAGPTFEFYSADATPTDQLLALCEEVADRHAALDHLPRTLDGLYSDV